MPEIVIKQSQIVKRFLDNCNDITFYQVDNTPFGFNPKIKKHLIGKTFRKLIYPTWNTETFSSGKTPNKIFSVRDQWLWDSNLESKTRAVDQIKIFLKKAGSYWLNDPTDMSKGVKRHASPRYYL